jgi:hypothetical protein
MGTKRPSYMKRLKEQKRTARAAEKRDARRARKETGPVPENDEEPALDELEITESQPEQ